MELSRGRRGGDGGMTPFSYLCSTCRCRRFKTAYMMNKYTLTEVNDRKSRKEFLILPVYLYRNEKNWIRPLDKDVEDVFDPETNKAFRSGECIRWILLDEKGKTIGRVAAFYDRKLADKNDQPTGGMGFFECINDREAAFMLFDACREWLREKGMEAMDGPVNFGDRDRWWGLLVDGFFEPNYRVNWNFSYYREMFEAYGFKTYFEQYTFKRSIGVDGIHPALLEKAERVFANPDYSFRHINKKDLARAAEEFRIIYNQAWASYPGAKQISKVHAMALLKSFKPVMDERLMWFAYYKDEPIGFYIMIPEINQIVKYLNGRMDIVGKIKFLYHTWVKTCKKANGVIFGVVPKFQGKGIEGGMIKAFANIALKPGFPYNDIELNWIGDFNPAMLKLADQLAFRVRKTHLTMRYLFDREKEFKRQEAIKRREAPPA
jgi:GNAT superfamily N-acetyltransferase